MTWVSYFAIGVPTFTDLITDMLEKRESNDIFMFLSRNETKSTYHETEEELLLAQVKVLIDARMIDAAEPPNTPEEGVYNARLKDILALAVKSSSRASNIWHCDHTVHLLLDLHIGGIHFSNSPLLKMSWLKNMAMDYGGVSAQLSLQYSDLLSRFLAGWGHSSSRTRAPVQHYAIRTIPLSR